MKSTPPGTTWAAAVLALALTAAGCSAVAQNSPTPTVSTAATTTASTTTRYTAKVTTSANTPLRLRAKPTTASKMLLTVRNGTVVTLTCRTTGDTITGPQGRSNVWQKVTIKKQTGYFSAAYLKGGDNGAVPACAGASTPSATPTKPVRGDAMNAAIVDIARSQLGVKETKNNCNPYGGCMAWCSLYATWVWRKAGDQIPKFPFTGDLYNWGKRENRAHDGLDGVGPGDLVLYGTGPKNTKTSVHVDIVIEVFDDHLRVIGGNVKDKVTERDVPKTGIYAWIDA